MKPPVTEVCFANAGVTALLGTTPTRLYPFGLAPQGVAKPYAVWAIISGTPENYLGDRPDAASVSIQFDVYADDADSVRDVARALQSAIELDANVTAYRGESRERDTNLYRSSFDVEWIVLGGSASS